MTSTTVVVGDAVEHDGLLWAPKSGATASAEEFIAARTRIVELQQRSQWNPWVMDDHEAEWDAAVEVFEQWTRAEPGFRTKTSRQVDAWMARLDREFEAKRKREDREYERNKMRYDPEREASRLALLEDQAYERYLLHQLDDYRSGRYGWGLPAEKREAEIAELEDKLATCRARIEQLIPVVGDSEDVVDRRGWLPSDRRELSLSMYRFDREREVRALRAAIVEHEAALKATKDKAEQAEIRPKLQDARYKLDGWLAVPPLTADEMCSECARPLANHGWRLTHWDGPCAAWPRHAAHIREVREMFFKMVERSKPAPPPPPKPEPLAVVPSGLPIADVMQRLAEIQKQHPDAVVKRGGANRWEVWPNTRPEDAGPS
ncbi:hypothetical protein [Jatrophihabitans lederbergiae]|uniref:Uncharacterized protein n=1 Tax=Jatrophihabitans lederbergiae TaxID=3075547 RepID=A0ABU2JF97_9ACTN|nr:hypothetical protein [Jatrophihabitans sp. DSM 44399]MDT0263421.1 hypothetical protein [Jatrophihabitans sp. DSM 44399]